MLHSPALRLGAIRSRTLRSSTFPSGNVNDEIPGFGDVLFKTMKPSSLETRGLLFQKKRDRIQPERSRHRRRISWADETGRPQLLSVSDVLVLLFGNFAERKLEFASYFGPEFTQQGLLHRSFILSQAGKRRRLQTRCGGILCGKLFELWWNRRRSLSAGRQVLRASRAGQG